MNARCVLFAVLAVLLSTPAVAKDIEVIGRGAAPLEPKNPMLARAQAIRAAQRNAVVNAMGKVLGPGATKDPRVAGRIDDVALQIPSTAFGNPQSAPPVGNVYEVTVTLVLDDKTFRTLLSDQGIAVNTSTARASSILAVMDEFLTTPRDVHAPLEELVTWRRDVGATFQDNSSASASSRSSDSVSVRGDASLTAAGSGANVEASQSLRGRAASQSSSSSEVVMAVAAEKHDVEEYEKLVKYQPQGGQPEKTSQAYNALMAELQDYDLRVLDNDQFKSRYFKDQPLTIEQLQNGEQLSRYVRFARTEANADFFMVGTSIVIDSGKNPNTGDLECTGVVTVKTYSTLDGESIASETISEASVGRNLNECAANVAKKLASIGGPVLGARVQEYWKRRETYGREAVLTLKGANLPLMVRTAFARSLKAVPGVENSTQRTCNAQTCQFVVTYKGADPLDQAVAMTLAENPAFATLDSRTDGNDVVLCMGPCAGVEAKP